jgi:putative endonuclease
MNNNFNKRTIGTKFEEMAVQHLIKNNYEIVEQNFRYQRGEIDIIAKENGHLVFIEVKYRSNTKTGLPEEAIDYRKIHRITNTARYYMLINHISFHTPCRFDVVTILKQDIKIIKNAFELM